MVLKPSYPQFLIEKKKYLTAGVAAAFECKLTLRKEHIRKVVQNCLRIKSLSSPRTGTPYKELYQPPIYGLLAHSFADNQRSRIISSTDEEINSLDAKLVRHPRHMLDFVCVADSALWHSSKEAFTRAEEHTDVITGILNDRFSAVSSNYLLHRNCNAVFGEQEYFSAVGSLLTMLLVRLAWEDPSLRDIASYFLTVEFSRLEREFEHKVLGENNILARAKNESEFSVSYQRARRLG